jgi:hypothetical protein
MLGTIRYVVGILVFLGIYATVLAPALSQVTDQIFQVTPEGAVDTGLITTLETVMFVGLPMILMAGVIILGFVVAVGLRGTSR